MKPAEAFRRPVSPGWNAGLEKANAEQAAAPKLKATRAVLKEVDLINVEQVAVEL